MVEAILKEDYQRHSKKLILVDGYGFVFRAYHSMPPLTDSEGTPVGAVFGFTNMLSKLIDKNESDYIAVILDAGSKTFRNDIYKEYKAHRPPAPEDLIPQFPLVRNAVEALGLPAIDMKGYEADDLIATYTRMATEKGIAVRIISSDKDLMQLVSTNVEMYDPMKSKVIGIEQVEEKFGVAPEKVLDVLSLIGDSADNIPGIPGIGPKIAAELIQRFGSLDETLARAGEVKQNKRRENLIQFTDQAKLSRDLVRLEYNVPTEISIEEFAVKKPNYGELIAFANKHGFKSVVSKFASKVSKEEFAELSSNELNLKSKSNSNSNNLDQVKIDPLNRVLINKIEQLEDLFREEKELKSLSIHFGVDKKDQIYGVGIAINQSVIAYLSVCEDQKDQGVLFNIEDLNSNNQNQNRITFRSLSKFLNNKVNDPSVLFISDNIKLISKLLFGGKVCFAAYDDISLMSYVLGAGVHSHSLEDISKEYLNDISSELSLKSTKNLDDNKIQEVTFNATEALVILHKYLKDRLFAEKSVTIYERMEKKLIPVLTEMETKGIFVDSSYLKELSSVFLDKIEQEEKKTYELAGREFNIGSPKQLGEILFEEMGIKGGKKSKKTGAYSTDSGVLEEISAQGYDIATHVLNWRHFSKLKSTYSDSLPKQIQEDGRIHTHYSMTSTNTGRLSSHNPNLQNIPIRSVEGNKIRQAFTCKDGYQLISADYSQIELRLLAHIAEIDTLRDAFRQGKDIHSATASQVFGVDINEVSSELRRKAKTINFGIIYGISAFGLANRLGISRSDAANYIDIYFKQYPGILNYMEKTKEFAKNNGYVNTLWGRRCYIKGINDKNGAIRQFSERAAINAPLQGSAADVIKKAMVALDLQLKKRPELQASLLLQVHDELIIEIPKENSEIVGQLVKKAMENVVNISIPLEVEVGIGSHWGEIH